MTEPSAKRIRNTPSPSEDDRFYDYDSVHLAEILASPPAPNPYSLLCVNCGTKLCQVCVENVDKLARREELKPDKYTIETEPDENQDIQTVTRARSEIRRDITNVDATRSLRSCSNLISSMSENFTPQSLLSPAKSELKNITIQELRKLHKHEKLQFLSRVFDQATSNLNEMFSKTTQSNTYENPLELTDQHRHYTQMNTLGSYGKFTLLINCEPKHLFTPTLCKQVLYTISSLEDIFRAIPEARDMLFFDETSEISKPAAPSTDVNPLMANDLFLQEPEGGPSFLFGGLKSKATLKYPVCPLYTQTEPSRNSSLFEKDNLLSVQEIPSTAQKLINQITEFLFHRDMNNNVVVACFDLLSYLNIYNPGNGPECFKAIMACDDLNILFELDNVEHTVLNAIVKFYTTLPLTLYFTSSINAKLFTRFSKFIQEYRKHNPLLYNYPLLPFFYNCANLHIQKLSKPFLNFIYIYAQIALTSCSFYKNVYLEELLSQIRLACFFLYREYADSFLTNGKAKRKEYLQSINREVTIKLKAAFEKLGYSKSESFKSLLIFD